LCAARLANLNHFGAVQLTCNQSDATFQLLTLDDRQEEAGVFPDLITELPEGNYKLISQHHGHQRTQTLAVKAGVTNDNPVEFSYGAADLKTTPSGASVQDADYIGGGKELNLALQSLPDNDEAKQLIADYKPHEPEQIERERVERLKRPREVFNDALDKYSDADLFDEHELTTSKNFKDVAGAIAQALKSGQPAFQITAISSPKPETYEIEALYEIPGFLGAGTTSGRHFCIIVCGLTKVDETQILFKVLEYKAQTTIKFSIGSLLNTATTDHAEYIPIHPSKIKMTDALQAQLTNGVQIVTGRIQQAIAQ
jgi:hypothetical protein